MARTTPHKFLAFLISACSASAALSAQSRELVRAWECEAVMDKPESAAWDPASGRIYISNICGEYFALDGNGYISVLDADGRVIEEKWLSEGLNNPQGLALVDGRLYIADLTRVVVVDTATAKIENVIETGDSKFLNDAAADADGSVYCSDSTCNRLYRFSGGKAEVWLESPELDSPNGLLFDGGRLIELNFNSGILYSIDRKSKALTEFCNGIANADGITSDGEGGFFASGAWQGEVFHIDPDGYKELVLDLGPSETVVADLLYIPEKQLLVIPTLGNSVLGYRWE